jgi:glycosyltransferase involved in cell wall biosynthesis
MRIAFIGSSLSSGGAERVLSILANEWAARNHEVLLLTIHGGESDFYPLDSRVRRVALGVGGRSGNIVSAIRSNRVRARKIAEALREYNADVAVSFMTRINVLVLLAARQYPVSVIVSERVDRLEHPETLPWRLLQRRIYREAAVVVAQTEQCAAHMRTLVKSERVRVIPNPVVQPELVSPAEAANVALPRRYFVAMGRLVPQKGFDLLVAAFSRLPYSVDAHLVIIGDGPQRAALTAQAATAGLERRVHLLGPRERPHTIIARAVAFVLSSRFEGFPNAMTEAMACGVPAIAFDCPSGPAAIVRHHVDGLLVPNGDVTAMAAAIQLLATDQELRERLANRASDVLSRFSLTEVMTRWEEAVRFALKVSTGLGSDQERTRT